MNNKGAKTNKTKIIIITISVILVAAIIFFIAAKNIVLNECASPCRHNGGGVCAAVCERVTLLDWILGNG